MKPETISLISNISLTEIGWRKKVYSLIINDCLLKEPQKIEILKSNCKDILGAIFNQYDFDQAINYATDEKEVKFENDMLHISISKKEELLEGEELRRADEEETKKIFYSIIEKLQISCFEWDSFKQYFIVENIKIFILNGREFESIYNEFASGLDPEKTPTITQIKSVIDELLNTNSTSVKKYLLSYVHGYFNIESLGMPERSIENLILEKGKTYNISLLLDTNYLFSILKLHENPSNILVNSIEEISKKLKGKILITRHVHPRTINEFNNSLVYEIRRLEKIKFSIPIAKAIISIPSHSGFIKQFAIQYLRSDGKLTVEDYIDPYVHNLTSVLDNYGIKIYNSAEDKIVKSDAYLDDLSSLLHSNEDYPDGKKRGITSIEHDLFLWHTINNARPHLCDSFLDAKLWIATIDYRFLSFDRSKKLKIPICLDPSLIIDMLQIWLPRDEIINEQLLNIIRIPLYSQEFDKDAEIATTKIISLISRFDSVDGLTEETIHKLLINKSLREKILHTDNQEEEVKLIQDNLLIFIEEASKHNDELKQEKKILEETLLKTESEEKERLNKIEELEIVQKRQYELLNNLNAIVKSANDSQTILADEKNNLHNNILELENRLADESLQKTLAIEWHNHWEIISSKWYHFPALMLFVIPLIIFGAPWVKAALENTSLANFDLRTLLAMPGCFIVLKNGLNLNNQSTSFKLLFLRNSFKKQIKNSFYKTRQK